MRPAPVPAILLGVALGWAFAAHGGAASAPPSPALLRLRIAETAIAQLRELDPGWEPGQRDCAGLVRHAYRSAYRSFAPARLARGLWRDGSGRAADFADAETLLRRSFVALGRDQATRAGLESGDLVAFRQTREPGDAVFHLMLVVRTGDPAHGRIQVVYHPGERDALPRAGALEDLDRGAPLEWRPVPENPAFLGFYRFQEWME